MRIDSYLVCEFSIVTFCERLPNFRDASLPMPSFITSEVSGDFMCWIFDAHAHAHAHTHARVYPTITAKCQLFGLIYVHNTALCGPQPGVYVYFMKPTSVTQLAGEGYFCGEKTTAYA